MSKRPDRIPHLKSLEARTGIPWDRISTQDWGAPCGCVFEQYKDDNDLSTVLFSLRQSSCPAHISAAEEPSYHAARGEAIRVEAVRRIIEGITNRIDGDVNLVPEWDDATRVVDGIQRKLSLRGFLVVSRGANGELVVTPNIPNQQVANSIQAAIDIQLGSGLVEFFRA